MAFPRAVARFNRQLTNRIARPLARRVPPFANVVHRGRRSGRRYVTPVAVFRTASGYVVALTYGPEADWVRNVLAAGECRLERAGAVSTLVEPRIVGADVGAPATPALVRGFLRALNVEHYLALGTAPRGADRGAGAVDSPVHDLQDVSHDDGAAGATAGAAAREQADKPGKERVEMTDTAGADTEVLVEAKGDVARAAKAYATEKMQRLFTHAHRPVLHARVKLTHGTDRSAERPDVAEASFDLNGRLVRAQVAAPHMDAAIDLLVDRMARQLERVADRERTRHRRRPDGGPGEWRHGDRPTDRPHYFPRPAEDREIVVHKSFGVGGATFEEAAFDMDVLDYDFFLYIDAESREDRVVHRTNGEVAMLTDPPDESVVEALERLDAGGEPFVFFRDVDNGRGAIAYRRYDGHYGVIRPADGE